MTPPPSTHHESEPSVQQRLQEWQAAGLITIEEQATISAYEDKKRATHIGHQRISLLEVGIYAAVAIGIFGVEFIVNGAIGTFTAVNLPAPTIQGTNALTFFVFAAAAAVAAFMLNRFPDAAAHRGVAASLAASYMFAAISIFLYLLWSGLGGDTLTRAIVAYSISLVLAGASIRWFANGWMASVFVGSAVVVTSTLIAKADWGANSWGFGVLWILYAALLLAVAEFAIEGPGYVRSLLELAAIIPATVVSLIEIGPSFHPMIVIFGILAIAALVWSGRAHRYGLGFGSIIATAVVVFDGCVQLFHSTVIEGICLVVIALLTLGSLFLFQRRILQRNVRSAVS